MRRPGNRLAAQGFTLTEMLIVVAMIGILAAIAYPSYRNYVVRANRADAQQTLLQAAQEAERFFAAANGYTGYTVSTALNHSPESGTVVYNIAVQGTLTANTFTVRATPVSGGVNASDGYLEITHTGVKRWDRNNDGDTGDTNETSWAR